MDIKLAIKSRLTHPIKKIVSTANYLNNNYKDVIWLIGDGRSGTTWVSDLINNKKYYRTLFEPFHPQFVKFLQPHQYLRPGVSHNLLEKMASDVFAGRYTGLRVDRDSQSFVFKGLLIKDIFANLISFWVATQFQKVKIVLLIRNPFSVALSKFKKKGAFWTTEPMDFLKQQNLYEDYLHPFESLIVKTSLKKDYILSQVLIWSIINYVPLCQFNPDQIHTVFYEDVYEDPNYEISRINNFINPCSENKKNILSPKIVNKPSRVSGTGSNIVRGVSPITSWKKELTSMQIYEGYHILQSFGFHNLYNEDSMPNQICLKNLTKK